METSQWPLTAAGTVILLSLPGSSAAKGARAPAAKDAVKLGLKELILRGAYRIRIERKRLGRDKVILIPEHQPPLPPALARFDWTLRQHTPGEIAAVIRTARRRQPRLIADLGSLFLTELSTRGLITQRAAKVLMIFPTVRWRRTDSGDAWALAADQHLQLLRALPPEVDRQPWWAARTAAAAGALVLLVPAALAALGRLRRRSRRHGGDVDLTFLYVNDDHGGVHFDPFDAVGHLFDSVFQDGFDSFDGLDNAMASVVGSIDAGVDSGVDSGAGDGGGGDGGGGGD